jgi:Na+-translocating ferredoxin:NAD+ oxidoreductase RNF subunit RnfB
LLAAAIVSGIGLILGLGLALASKVFAVPADEKAELIQEILPGANCGACGFSGCAGYAAALSGGETSDTALCAPGGAQTARKIAEITGLALGKVTKKTALVRCRGNSQNTESRFSYRGIQSCEMAAQLYGGEKSCTYGCLGFGDCARECPYGAISVCDDVARVNPELCRACRKCVAACPRGLIDLVPVEETNAAVLCRNRHKGAQTRKECRAGCIGCMRCVKACEFGAVAVGEFCAKVNFSKCTGCGKCAAVCPVGCITLLS